MLDHIHCPGQEKVNVESGLNIPLSQFYEKRKERKRKKQDDTLVKEEIIPSMNS